MQHYIKGYSGIYINFDNFTFKVGGYIDTDKRNLKHSRDSVTKINVYISAVFRKSAGERRTPVYVGVSINIILLSFFQCYI